MAIVIKKKKKKLGGHYSNSGTSGKKITSLRPYANPQMSPCQQACPMGSDIRRALTFVGKSETYKRSYTDALEQAWYIFTNTNPLPAVLGRVCPHPCEDKCNRTAKDGAVNINQFERSIGDYGLEKKLKLILLTEEKRDQKIAVIGSGPAGISCAYQLARRGYQVTIFEAFPMAGGMLRYGIPSYRLPREIIDAEIQRVLDLGVELKTNTVIGKDITLAQLRKDFNAVYIGIGCHKGRTLGVPGEDADNIMVGSEFLNKINSGDIIDIGNDVVVVGGGNSAIDTARVCKRLGASTTIICNRTRKDMPAIVHEIDEAEAEGIKFEFLSIPVEVVKKGNKAVRLICNRMELGEPDVSGYKRPNPIVGATYDYPISMLIAAISQEPEFIGDMDTVGNAKDWVKVDKEYFRHELKGVYGGGDAVQLGLVAIAVGQGARAAEVIDADIRNEKLVWSMPLPVADKIKCDWYPLAERNEQTVVPVENRLIANTVIEINNGLDLSKAIEESKRCFSCGMCMDCDNCWMYCQDQAVENLSKNEPIGQHYFYKHKLCTGCEKCAEECPCGYLQMK